MTQVMAGDRPPAGAAERSPRSSGRNLEERATLSVGEAAGRVGLTTHTLRWYEQEGLVAPVGRDSVGRRRYTESDVGWLEFLLKLRRTGMPVRDMRRYAELAREGDHTLPERLRLFQEHRERVLSRISELQADLEVLNYKIDVYGKLVAEGQQA